MEWMQILSLFLANAGLIVWFRSESRSDWRHLDSKLDLQTKEFRDEMKSFREIWMQESKDFHERLCSIEERNRK